MKYRLIELLQCPSHPEQMLRVLNPHVSDIFPCAGDYLFPICRMGCGYLSNWFRDIPESLPLEHRFDCRRCMGMEIESAVISCPECGWSLEIQDGVLHSPHVDELAEYQYDHIDIRKTSSTLDKFLKPRPADLVLSLVSLPENLSQKWASEYVERLQVELSDDVLAVSRARSCTDASTLAHFIRGPLDLSIIRKEYLSSLILSAPTDFIADYEVAVQFLPGLMKPSGKIVMILDEMLGNSDLKKAGLEQIKSQLPEPFNGLSMKLINAGGFRLLLIEHPKPEARVVTQPVAEHQDTEIS